ncbi:ABC transporter permease [Georgenia yuyongxinii]|uniref:ABC transporter permease n=1 Tax=Georgenia yuyongxinii TaxID=2589797 RepID=UPI001E53DD06
MTTQAGHGRAATLVPSVSSADRTRTVDRLSRPPRRAVPLRRRGGAAIVAGAVVLVAWELVSRAGVVPAFFLPAPTAVAVRLGQDLTTGNLLAYTAPTLVEAALGCVLGTVVALPLGYAVFRSRWAAAALEPYIAASQALPAVAVAPLLTIWLGYGLVPIAVLCALLVFFPILLATVHGLRSLDPDVVAAARLDGAGEWDLLRSIQLPLALPSLLTGLRNGFTLSVTGAVVGEMVIGGEGLGLMLAAHGRSADTTGIFSTLIVLCALAMAIYGLLTALERHLVNR